MPALLTRTSICPVRESTVETREATAASSVTSQVSMATPWGPLSMVRRLVPNTVKPARTKASALQRQHVPSQGGAVHDQLLRQRVDRKRTVSNQLAED